MQAKKIKSPVPNWKRGKQNSEAKGGEGGGREKIRARTYPYHLDSNNFAILPLVLFQPPSLS